MAILVNANSFVGCSIDYQWGDRLIKIEFTPATVDDTTGETVMSTITISDYNDGTVLATGQNTNTYDIYL